jgi:hypothetical protein
VACKWTENHTRQYLAEVEERFRARTPAKSILDINVETRVTRSEMRSWSRERLGMLPPETDEVWLQRMARVYRRMAKRAMRNLPM